MKVIATFAAAAILAASLLAAPPAAAAGPRCATARADVATCRAHGWFMRPAVHIGPKGWVRFLGHRMRHRCSEYVGTWPELRTSPGRNGMCFWNQQRRGRGHLGESYIVVGHYPRHWTRQVRFWTMLVRGFRLGSRA